MAARTHGVGHDRLHHFVAAGVWDAEPLEAALPEKWRRSVGVAPQPASALGKNAHCQTMVSVTLARDEVPVMVGLRPSLPESWTGDPERLARARVTEERWTYRTKPEIALAGIDRVRAAGVRFGCVLADAGHGLGAPFRQGLGERGRIWTVGVLRRQKPYPVDVGMIFPVAGRARPR